MSSTELQHLGGGFTGVKVADKNHTQPKLVHALLVAMRAVAQEVTPQQRFVVPSPTRVVDPLNA
jgi:hypothetical protein